MRGAEGVHFVVDHAGGGGGFVCGEELQPGVCEGDDGRGDAVRAHEGEFAGEGGVGLVEGAAVEVGGEVRGRVGGEDYEAWVGGGGGGR